MHSSTWKKFEMKVARMFGYERALMKGTATKEDAAPPEGADAAEWVIDAKLKSQLNIWSWMADLVEYAKEKGKPAIVVFRHYPKLQAYAVVEYEWFFDSFLGHISLFTLQQWHKNEMRNFTKAWKDVKEWAEGSELPRIPGLLMAIKAGELDYVCIKAENLISLMKAKGMLKEENDEE